MSNVSLWKCLAGQDWPLPLGVVSGPNPSTSPSLGSTSVALKMMKVCGAVFHPDVDPDQHVKSSDHRTVALRIRGSVCSRLILNPFILSLMKPAAAQRSPVARGIVGSSSSGLCNIKTLKSVFYGPCLRARADLRPDFNHRNFSRNLFRKSGSLIPFWRQESSLVPEEDFLISRKKQNAN